MAEREQVGRSSSAPLTGGGPCGDRRPTIDSKTLKEALGAGLDVQMRVLERSHTDREVDSSTTNKDSPGSNTEKRNQ